MVEMCSLQSMNGITLIHRVRYNVFKEKYGIKENIVTKIKKGLGWTYVGNELNKAM